MLWGSHYFFLSRFFYVFVLITLLTAPPWAATAGPVALVLEANGAITPPLQAFSEIEAGTTVDLGSGGRLQFLHYPTCQNVAVEGGKLSLTAENFRVSKGKIIDMSRAECPEKVVLAASEAASGIAGVVLRGADDGTLKVSQRPEFVLLGAARAQFSQLRIMRGREVVFDASLEKTPVKWPENQPGLQTGGDYSVLLSGSAKQRRIKLIVGSQQVQKSPAIIQLD